MIWLFIIVPIMLLLGIVIYLDRKNKGFGIPPDVNKGNHNIEAETTRNEWNNGGGFKVMDGSFPRKNKLTN